ncbi:MAG: hypothetical protein ACQETP_11950 [Bacteroidota bacterium]
MSASSFRRRARRTLLGTLLVYALLVATHLGEFWPFSIYPMFSQGGNDWSRAVVRTVPDTLDPVWETTTEAEQLPGTGFPLTEYGIDPIDLSNYVSKTEAWTLSRTAGLRTMFGQETDQHTFLVMRVNGQMTEQDSVVVEYVPYALVRDREVELNPSLPRSDTQAAN